jgi:DNA-binding NarL/FixJ family response regulator
LCHGYNNKQISELIHLNTKTIEKYKSILFRKTNCMNTVNLVIYAFKNELADPN